MYRRCSSGSRCTVHKLFLILITSSARARADSAAKVNEKVNDIGTRIDTGTGDIARRTVLSTPEHPTKMRTIALLSFLSLWTEMDAVHAGKTETSCGQLIT
eukprot:SAG11_NODE_19274_length_470_cov_1.064690_1_plen_100_part_01